jgi:hypothetical protein
MHLTKTYWIFPTIFLLVSIVWLNLFRLKKSRSLKPIQHKGQKTFLCVYDYGMGGIWVLLSAESKEQIIELYPELIVYDDKPDWMDQKQKQEFIDDCVNNQMYWNIKQPATGWLKILVEGRKIK